MAKPGERHCGKRTRSDLIMAAPTISTARSEAFRPMSVTNADWLEKSRTASVITSGAPAKEEPPAAPARNADGNITRSEIAVRSLEFLSSTLFVPGGSRHRSREVISMLARVALVSLICGSLAGTAASEPAWPRHTIDNSSRGADGVRIADVNHDGMMDLTTGWEEGGVVRVYLNPGPAAVKLPWPAVTVGNVRSPEDAVLTDIDGDGAMDVVSSCEGNTRQIFIHWAPENFDEYLEADAWRTDKLPCTDLNQMWMFCLPLQVDQQFGIDLIVGSKGANATVGWVRAPVNPRDTAGWTYHPLYEGGWIMSLIARDIDHDGDQDVLVSDRKGPRRGVLWLENPGGAAASNHARWNTHRLGGADREVMFLAIGGDDGDYPGCVFAACRGSGIAVLSPPRWTLTEIPMPENCGTGKGVAVHDINLDGSTDIVFSCENATGDKSGVRWMSRGQDGGWEDHEISGPEGIKFDRIELLDLDGDGDLDVVTCEERANLGVIWYENPTR